MKVAEIHTLASDLDNWQPIQRVAEEYPQFSISQLRWLMWKREEHSGLKHCVRVVGRRMYINKPLFGIWLSSGLSDNTALASEAAPGSHGHGRLISPTKH